MTDFVAVGDVVKVAPVRGCQVIDDPSKRNLNAS
jgi:hypothetical protein